MNAGGHSILLDKTDKKNQKQRGALMFRYAKNTPLRLEVASYQSAVIFGIFHEISDKDAEELTSRFVSQWTELRAKFMPQTESGARLHRRPWPAIKPPPNAVL